MSLTPNYASLTKEQTFSSVAKGTAHIPVALDNSYPAGGYAVDSSLLFNQDGYTFRLLNGYATDGTNFRRVLHDVAAGKLMVLAADDTEIPNGTDLSTFTAYLTFHRW